MALKVLRRKRWLRKPCDVGQVPGGGAPCLLPIAPPPSLLHAEVIDLGSLNGVVSIRALVEYARPLFLSSRTSVGEDFRRLGLVDLAQEKQLSK